MSLRASAGLPFTCSGRHVAERAEHDAGLGARRRRQVRVLRDAPSVCVSFARPKSRILTRPSLVTNTFSGFQVAVDDPLLVRGGEAVRELDRVLRRLAHGERAARHPRAQRLALEQLRDDVRRAVVRAEVVDRGDVRVIQPASGLRLLLEAPQRSGSLENVAGRTLIATSRLSRESRAR
jgi:predicted nuclease with RNAse H fold